MSPLLSLSRLAGPAALAALSLSGCAAMQKQELSYDLDATQAALGDQMEETARLEAALAQPETPPEPPGNLIEALTEPEPEPEPEPELTPTEEALSLWEEAAPAAGAPASGSSLSGSAERIAQALEFQVVFSVMESRLEDKQRQIDAITGGTAASASAREAQLRQQLAAAAAEKKEIADRLAAAEAARTAAEQALAAQQARVAELEAAPGAPVAEEDPEDDPIAQLRAEMEALREASVLAEEQRRQEDIQRLTAQQQELARQAEAERKRQDSLLERLFSRQEAAPAAAPAQPQGYYYPPQSTTPVVATGGMSQAEVQALISAAIEADRAARAGEAASAEADAEQLAEERAALSQELEALRNRMEQIATGQAASGEAAAAQDAKRAELEAEIARLQGRDEEISALQAELEALQQRDAQRAAALEKKLAPIRAAGLEVEVIDGSRALVRLPSDVLFSSGSASLSIDGQRTVQRVAGVLIGIPGVTMQVDGHTDNVPMRSSRYASNWDLAFARAREVLGVLVGAGVPADTISAASYGDTRPVSANDSRDGRAANRRIEIALRIDEPAE